MQKWDALTNNSHEKCKAIHVWLREYVMNTFGEHWNMQEERPHILGVEHRTRLPAHLPELQRGQVSET